MTLDINNSKEDQELMFMIAAQDIGAYRALVDRYLNRAVRFAERMLGDHAMAEDVAQELCIKLWNEAPRWEPKAKVSTWIYKLLTNACIDQLRKKKPASNIELEEIHDHSASQAKVLENKEESAMIRSAIDQLPERQRTALALCYYEEMSNEKAAEVMELSVGAVQQLLFRARANLKEILADKLKDVRYG